MSQLWQVAVNAPLREPFTYCDREGLDLALGQPVTVPFGPKNRQVAGLIVGQSSATHLEFEAKEILQAHPERPILHGELLQWLQWMANHYIYPLGRIQELVFPPLKKESRRGSRKGAIVPEVITKTAPALTTEQRMAVASLALNQFQTYLLHGVTGSGKTEVYIEWIEQALAQGQTAMVLVPEISLTPQLIRRFAERFPDEIAVLHSHLTDRERTDQWWLAVEKKKRLLIGARSALFCPMPDLGIIIVDEEHESSFKQEEKLKYNARDSAVMRGQFENIPVVLGSATPSLESWSNAQTGKYKLLTMKNRVSDRPLPVVDVVNMLDCRDKPDFLPHWLSPLLYEKLKNTYENQFQSALFLNRRGVAPSVQCYSCGFIYMCPNCDISLTLHGKSHLVCHYCNYHQTMDSECPDCKEGEPKAYGLGTEAVENDILKLFPGSRVFRADRDEINSREAMEEMIHLMESREIDFLIGTQMIAKGLDFTHLTLVGLVHADIAFNIPDFRANERSFQLCTQVSGRAGRHGQAGEVVIQTYKPDHPSLVAAREHDYQQFAESELQHRQLFHYPPYGRIMAIRLSGLHESEVVRDGESIMAYCQGLIGAFASLKGSQALGPTPAPLSRIKNRYRYHILVKSPNHQVLNFIGHKVAQFMEKNIKKTKCLLDVDPYTLL
ncbi:MAG: primosomal protein N' [Bdellovibrionales bacterium]|nr:primosomal protein N' [Bdellovibrionales bacterium]